MGVSPTPRLHLASDLGTDEGSAHHAAPDRIIAAVEELISRG
jgi:hypothetical protein